MTGSRRFCGQDLINPLIELQIRAVASRQLLAGKLHGTCDAIFEPDTTLPAVGNGSDPAVVEDHVVCFVSYHTVANYWTAAPAGSILDMRQR